MAPRARTVALRHEVRGSGPPVMLIAGTGYPGRTWQFEPFLAQLAAQCTVITFDHRGVGGSPSTPDPYSTRQFAADALALLRALGVGPAYLVGHSMGGRVAQWMALDAPDQVAGLALVASGPGKFKRGQRMTRGVPVPTCLGLAEHGYRGYMERHIKRSFFTEEFAEENPGTVAWLVDAFWADRPDLENYLKHVVARQTHQTARRLPEIGQPCLVLVGERDTNPGGTGSHLEQSHYLAEHLARATLRCIPQVSHGCFWQAPDATVKELLGWLDNPCSTGSP